MVLVQIQKEKVEKAVKELQKYYKRETNFQKKGLFNKQIETISLIIMFKEKFEEDIAPRQIFLPKPYLNQTAQKACFFGDAKDLPTISKIISIDKIFSDYRQYKDKRLLCSKYDFFFCYDKDFSVLKRGLGTSFFKRKKTPIALDSKSDDINQDIIKAYDSTYFTVPEGRMVSYKVGCIEQKEEDLIENILETLPMFLEKIGRELNDIRKIGVSFRKLPLLVVFRNSDK